MANRWGNNGNSDRLLFSWAPKSLQMVTAATKLKEANLTFSLSLLWKWACSKQITRLKCKGSFEIKMNKKNCLDTEAHIQFFPYSMVMRVKIA